MMKLAAMLAISASLLTGAPAYGQYRTPSDCRNIGSQYDRGYCVDFSDGGGSANTVTSDGWFVLATYNSYSNDYLVSIGRDGTTILAIWLDGAGNVTSIPIGSLSVAQQNRATITGILDVIDSYYLSF